MFQALVQRLLGKILGEYIQNFSAENLKIGIWSGQVVLRNVVLKRSVIKKLNLPLRIMYSRLGCLKMNIPWKSLTSSKIEILLEGFELVVAEVPVTMWECKNTQIIEKRKKEIESFCEAVVSDFAKKGEKVKEGQEGYFSKLVMKIVDNLHVTIRDIHIRYEDDLTKSEKSYSFGVTLEEFKLYTVNAKGEPEYIDRSKPEYAGEPLRKRLQLYNIGVYWNEKGQLYTEANYEARMGSTIAKRGQTAFSHNYVILMSSQAQLLQLQPGKQFFEPEIALGIQLENLKIQITNTQLQQIITLAERLQKYTNKVREENKQVLTSQEIKRNKEYFIKIFPDYYSGWGKNLSKEDMQKFQLILQKMQVQNFTKEINQYLQSKQKERIIKEKQEKNRGWWFGKPKQLTPQQLREIENYLNNNFGQEVSIVKRPLDYYYIKIGFKLARLEVVIANNLAFIKEGIEARFDELDINFSLRDGGYSLGFTMEDIGINIFKQIGVEAKQYKQILYKLYQKTSKLKNSYLSMQVIGNPLYKKYLNTDIKLATSQLMIVFDPKIISIAMEFANLNLSKENKEAAMQKFGEIKQKTQAVVNETIDKPVKAQIGVDVRISSITVAVPFSPHRPNGYCWSLNLGSVHFTTDQETLKRLQPIQNLPLDVFNLELTQFSFKFYPNIIILKQKAINKKQQSALNALIQNLDFRLKVQAFNKATQTQAKIKIRAILPTLYLNLNEFSYKNLLRIGDAFQLEQKKHEQRMTTRINEKKQIQAKASKVGFVYIKDSLTKIWKKYVAIMTDHYIYLYLNKNDKEYTAYYYIKGAKLQKYKEQLDKQKPYHFRIKNKVNQVVFGFDKMQQIQDWINKIKTLNRQQQMVDHVLNATMSFALSELANFKPPKKHDIINLFIRAQIQTIKINVLTTQSAQDKVVKLKFEKLSSNLYFHESKKRIELKLFGLQLQDSIQRYKSKELGYFLLTKRKHSSQNLINLQIQQLNKDHPKYDHTDSTINVSFGTLVCNYKCETVKTLMGFFIPPPSHTMPPALESADLNPSESFHITASFSQQINDFQTYSLKLNLKIKEIAVTLVNQKIKTILGRIGITDLDLYMGISQKRMILIGSLKDLYFIDTTAFPRTIYKQQEEYPNERTILTANIGQDKNMLDFNIQILKQGQKRLDKKMFIDIKLANLTTYYVQQPILRIITYLNTQMLPSFETGPKQQKKMVANDSKPEPTSMVLSVVITNISVFVETQYKGQRKQEQEYMQLNIEKITVKNSSEYKSYLKSTQKRPIILVENYHVQLYALSISVRYFDILGKLHGYKLTNNLDMTVSTDLIANPEYYKKELPQKFDNGLRVQCIMKPFFMRTNHDDYNFIMKCLNWGITHNDGLDDELFDIPANQSKIQDQQLAEKDPFYLVVKMDCLSLFITKQSIPIAFLLLDKMVYNLCIDQKGMNMNIILNKLYGTSIQQIKQQKVLVQIGVFNSLGYNCRHKMDDLNSLQSYIRIFDRRDKVAQYSKADFLNCAIGMDEKSLIVKINMDELWIDVDVRLLMVLSTLANTDQNYIQGPQQIKKIYKEDQLQEKKDKSPSKLMELQFQLKKLVGSVSDLKNQKYFLIQGGILFNMSNHGEKTIEQIQDLSFRMQMVEGIQHSQMSAVLKNFTVYFSKIKQGKIIAKRQFLRPNNIEFDLKKYYKKIEEVYILQTDITANIQQMLLIASLKDILNINKIVQDNLQVLDQFKSQSKPEEKHVVQLKKEDIPNAQIVLIFQKLVKQIQLKTKIMARVAPIQVEIVNDCDNNFMPVLRLLIQDTEPAMHQSILKTQVFIVPIISLYFFNPRSSRWEPIIEPFKIFISYKSAEQGSNISIITNTLSEETSSLKINISTQMLSTIMATKEILQAEKNNIDRNIQTKEIEVSPYIFYNITNQKVYLIRGESEFELSPMFKGPIRFNGDKIRFRLNNQEHKFSLDHYGSIRIPQSQYFIKFDTQKLNRIIKFLPMAIIKNRLHQPIYIKRFGNVPEIPKKVEINEPVPLDNVEAFAVSLNGNSYTQKVKTKDLKLTGFMLAQKKNFVVLLRYKERIDKFTFANLLSPFVIYNCLPRNLNIQFIQKAKTKSTVTINSQQSYSVFTSEDIQTLELKAYISGYSWSAKFKYHHENDTNESQLLMEDEDGFKTTINYIYKKNKNTNQFILIVYCKRIIVNELNQKLLVYGNLQSDQKGKKSDRYYLLGGQCKDRPDVDEKIIMVGEEVGNKIRVCGSDSMIDFATPIAIGGIGSSQSRIVIDYEYEGKRQSLFTVLGVEIGPMKMMKQCDIFSKKIVLSSKSIIMNLSDRDIIITEQLSTKYPLVCEAGCKKNVVFSMPDISSVREKYKFSAKGLKDSNYVDMPTQGAKYFKMISIDQLDKKGRKKQYYFKIFVQEIKSYMFYEIREINKDELPYQIVVKSRFLTARVPKFNLVARKEEDCYFFKEEEQQEQYQLQMTIHHADSNQEIIMFVYPDDLRFKQKRLVSVQKGQLVGSVAVEVQVIIKDRKKTIFVDEVIPAQQPKQVRQGFLSIQLAEIILSINQNSESVQAPYESIVLTLRRLILVKYQTDKKIQYQAKLGFLQIDQAYPYILSSPVILTPFKYELFTKQKDPKNIFNFTIVFSKEFVQNTFISEISVDMDDIVATFSADFINLITLISAQFMEVINYKENTFMIDKKTQKWQDLEVPPQGNNVYIKSIKISPFVIDLSAELNIKKLNLQNELLKTLLSTVGIVMSNIDAPIQMTGIAIDDCIDTVDSITKQLVAHYRRTCVNQFYKLFGSLNIIGNPIGLFRNISTGVKDLRDKPAQGFVNGPVEFGIGIAQGTGSLIAHSIGGAFSSISKVTGTFSTGLATLAFDKDFEEHRQKQKMKKPQNVIQGLQKGGKAIFYGFKEGFTGVFTQPYENAKKQGALGFLKGAGKGLAGLVVKPVTGIIDFASKTTEGIKNNALIFEDKAHQIRMRNPRVFYTECYILKEYSRVDSQLYSIMKKMQNQERFVNPIFVEAYATAIPNEYLVILHNSIAYMDMKGRHVKWTIDFNVLQLENNKERKALFFKRKAQNKNFFNVCCTSIKVDFDVEIESDRDRQEIVDLINSLINERYYH